MRSEDEMMKLILDIAMKDERIRLVTLEGSRTNKNVPRDKFQDYDISYFVTDMDSFTSDDSWLDQFGERMMMQKPEDMELFPPELGDWFSYLMLFKDHHKIDLTLIPLSQTEDYFTQSDGLAEIVLDKDDRINRKIIASDEQYHIKKPTPREFDDCCNEFWMVSTYVIKGLMRKEILFALDHMNDILRPNVLRMIAWNIGIENQFSLSVGKNYKYIQHYMNAKDWEILLNTYVGNTYESVWKALFDCQGLFRAYSKSVAVLLRYEYPEYDQQITEYTLKHYQRFQSDFSL
ncbi:aminoglycoside 6-adenylyltransferase [Bacillus sp. LJBV19]|uniref:aminoglycoside 6-adenylyltransferase n=1 Tax=Bacillus sp. LJBV19 TaxID=2821409 RepID=UPI001ADFF718|nr:aminoglycoside 6-adenylyltransferase [Bacillus sp. LJBV19]QTN96376.1 aminoglycoside 6-adenylyltransferase [Bacillus sp. LJBV19]